MIEAIVFGVGLLLIIIGVIGLAGVIGEYLKRRGR